MEKNEMTKVYVVTSTLNFEGDEHEVEMVTTSLDKAQEHMLKVWETRFNSVCLDGPDDDWVEMEDTYRRTFWNEMDSARFEVEIVEMTLN